MPDVFTNWYVSMSTGFATTTYSAFGATFVISGMIDFVMFTFVWARSRRD